MAQKYITSQKEIESATQQVLGNTNAIYVSKLGSNNNDGRSFTRPLLTFEEALIRASNESLKLVICLDTGSFDEQLEIPNKVGIYAPFCDLSNNFGGPTLTITNPNSRLTFKTVTGAPAIQAAGLASYGAYIECQSIFGDIEVDSTGEIAVSINSHSGEIVGDTSGIRGRVGDKTLNLSSQIPTVIARFDIAAAGVAEVEVSCSLSTAFMSDIEGAVVDVYISNPDSELVSSVTPASLTFDQGVAIVNVVDNLYTRVKLDAGGAFSFRFTDSAKTECRVRVIVDRTVLSSRVITAADYGE